ncbi:tyrosine-type recombinase/integrase [Clostridium chromiireducens]|uniref:Tyrosine-type recombinase/integrase n=1 Tax=Clostridium chromiireducens TaxID=225345 RepID=A0A964RSC2_9CLOT|nr:tyrosine-type recombinase/integrase [Clostridium chromiireducens]
MYKHQCVINYRYQHNYLKYCTSLKHIHATLLPKNSANFKDIQKRLGHSKLPTTMETYRHVKRMKNEIVNIFEKYIKKTCHHLKRNGGKLVKIFIFFY